MRLIKDVLQASIVASMIGGPFFYYILFCLKEIK